MGSSPINLGLVRLVVALTLLAATPAAVRADAASDLSAARTKW
jgi:hypothetical protein